MKRILAIFPLVLFATVAQAVDTPITCTGNSCNVVIAPRNSGGTATTAISSSGATGLSTVTGGLKLPTSGGTPSTLNYYEETGAVTLTTSNTVVAAGTSSGLTAASGTYYAIRNGNIVTVYINPAIASFAANAGTVTGIRVEPGVRFLPTFSPNGSVASVLQYTGTFNGVWMTVAVESNSSSTHGWIISFSSYASATQQDMKTVYFGSSGSPAMTFSYPIQ